MNVIYTEIALEDLRRIPRRFAAQIVAKISQLEYGLRRGHQAADEFRL